jgi:hypothetical protein
MADYGLTHLLIKSFGAREANPAAAEALRVLGFKGLLLYKLIAVAIVVLVILLARTRSIKVAKWLGFVACAFTGTVVMWSAWLTIFPH